MDPVIRRRSAPLMCQYLWDAITTIRNHKQLPSFERIRRYMNRTHSMEHDAVETYLEECTLDNLIIVSRKVGQKGSKVGVEQEGFRLPTPPDEPESHDWYCYNCHKPGEVVLCSKCCRVFHAQCLSLDFIYQPNCFVCPICQKRLLERSPSRGISREELNGLLIHVASQLKKKMPHNILERIHVASQSASGGKAGSSFPGERGAPLPVVKPADPSMASMSEPWRAQLLLHQQMDLTVMEQKARDGRYKTLYDFEVDVQTLAHNIIVFHGVSSGLSDLASQIMKEAQHDMSEIELCKDCFRHAMDKSQIYWFCKPCRPPHELVYVKDKSYPYWPAKVLKIESHQYYVRFFGSNHQAASVDKSCIKPITTDIHSLQMKRTSAWMKAFEELKKHQEYSANGYMEPTAFQPPPPPPPQSVPSISSYPPHHSYQPPLPAQFQQPYSFHPQRQFAPPQFHQFNSMLRPPHPPLWNALPEETHHKYLREPLEPCHPPHFQFQPAPSNPKPEMDSAVSLPSVSKVSPAVTAAPPPPQPPPEEIPAAKKVPAFAKPPPSPQLAPAPNIPNPAPDCSPADAAAVNSSLADSVIEMGSEENVSLPVSSTVKSAAAQSVKREAEDLVSSSSQDHHTQSKGVQTSLELLNGLIEEVMPDHLSTEKTTEHSEKEQSGDSMPGESEATDALRAKEEELTSRLSDLEEKMKREISNTKRKQWCWTCETEAIYHCCWNTAYCSVQCQQAHWHKEHKKNCRRK